jgi:hypothetical protein
MKSVITGLKSHMVTYFDKKISNFIFKVQISDIYDVDGKYYLTGTNIINQRQVEDIKLSSHNLGNGKGIVVFPKVGDICLCLNLLGEFIILGNVYDDFSTSPDNQVNVSKGELVLINKDWGTMIKFDEFDNLNITTKTGGKIKLNKTGGFKLYDKSDYGIESDGLGNITINGDITFNGTVSGLEYTDTSDSGTQTKTVTGSNSKINGNY